MAFPAADYRFELMSNSAWLSSTSESEQALTRLSPRLSPVSQILIHCPDLKQFGRLRLPSSYLKALQAIVFGGEPSSRYHQLDSLLVVIFSQLFVLSQAFNDITILVNKLLIVVRYWFTSFNISLLGTFAQLLCLSLLVSSVFGVDFSFKIAYKKQSTDAEPN